MQMVNAGFPEPAGYGFERVDARRIAISFQFPASALPKAAINRKFTPNRINRFFRKFSAILPQCKHLRFIDGC
jgi:hypothetical protein